MPEQKKQPFIMVVDDDEEIRKIVSRTLTLEGFDVATANDGISALALMEERKPDLVVLDIVMPGLDGFQVLDHMRKTSDVPVLILTGKCEINSLQQALVAGADDYVKKPFSTRVLVARIRAKLRRAAKPVFPKSARIAALHKVPG